MLATFNDYNNFPKTDLKDMEWKTGFMVHPDMEYPLIMPFLRSLYLTMNSWIPKIYRDGWK